MGFMFCDLHVSLNPLSGDINSSNLSCLRWESQICCMYISLDADVSHTIFRSL